MILPVVGSTMTMMPNRCNIIRICIIAVLLLESIDTVRALFEDEVGLFDFAIKTSGHGPVKYIESTSGGAAAGKEMSVIVTSDSGPSIAVDAADTIYHPLSWISASHDHPTSSVSSSSHVSSSCYVTCRDALTGVIRWRRNVCSNDQTSHQVHLTLVTSAQQKKRRVITFDVTSGTFRSWGIGTGSLLKEIHLQQLINDDSSIANRIVSAIKKRQPLILWQTNDPNYVALNDIIAFDIESGATSKSINGKPPLVTSGNKVIALEEVTISLPEADGESSTPQHELVAHDKSNDSPATTTKLNNMVETDTIESIHLVQRPGGGAIVIATTQKGMTAAIRFGSSSSMTAGEILWQTEEGLGQVSSALLLDASHTTDLLLGNGMGVSDTSAGETSKPSIVTKNHPALQFSKRLLLQWKTVSSLAGNWVPARTNNDDDSSSSYRDYSFGMVKIALLLTPYKLIAIDTSGGKQRRGSLRYQIDLPSAAAQYEHKMIHGSVNAPSGVHGINGGAHTREVLVVSYLKTTSNDDSNNRFVRYTCFDGTNGDVIVKGSVELSSTKKIIQVVPISSNSDSSPCRQDALLVLDDHSVISVLDARGTSQLIQKYSSGTPHGFYTHVVDKEASRFYSLLLPSAVSSSSPPEATLVGSTSFHGESIVQVAYPNREEVVQSPCNVLGDESLLLKYLNPHMMVVVTVRNDDMTSTNAKHTKDRELITSALLAESSGTKQNKGKQRNRKPLGVTNNGKNAAESATASATTEIEPPLQVPNLFVNIMDSVSGRIIYRISHVNAVTATSFVGRPMNVLISENWVFYSFVNERTRRTEIGVLSLYEGMIDPKGLTAFTSPQSVQSSTFSSLDARESKPIGLAKTYTIPKAITALGITSSRGGISVRKLLLATADGQIQSIDRKFLEPRRPVGQVKDSEKKEGLQQYNELIPIISFTALSYNLTIEDVKTITSVPTDLESQTIIMAYGGCDIYIARISPSRGFDLLPDSFNKLLLLFVVVALFVVVTVAQQMGTKKILKHGWI